MGISIQDSSSLSRPDMANINDIAQKRPEVKMPEPVEFAKAEIKAPEKASVEIKKSEPVKVDIKEQEIAAAASYAKTAQGDDVTVTDTGMKSLQAGGTIQASEDNGIVAKKDTIEISYSTEAGDKLREQLHEIQKSKAEAIHEGLESLKAHDESVNERQSFMIESNASLTLSNPNYLSEEAKESPAIKEMKEAQEVDPAKIK